jgi:hypothetical protein
MTNARKPGPSPARRQGLLLLATLLALTAVAAGVERYRLADGLAQAADAPPAPAAAEPAPAPPAGEPAADGEPPAPAPVDEVTDAEMEAQLEAIEAVTTGRPDASEQAAEKPLPADLPVALPSDI